MKREKPVSGSGPAASLREAGRLVKATSQTVLERLEEATDELNALLR